MPVFVRRDEGLHHFRVLEVSVELVQLGQPKVVAGIVMVRSVVGISLEITKLLHQDKRAVEF
jgi:hypothetical protein